MGLKHESRIYDSKTGVPQWLHGISGGVLGFLMPVLQEAFELAITPNKAGVCKEKIDKEILEKAIRYIPDGLSDAI